MINTTDIPAIQLDRVVESNLEIIVLRDRITHIMPCLYDKVEIRTFIFVNISLIILPRNKLEIGVEIRVYCEGRGETIRGEVISECRDVIGDIKRFY